MAEPVPVQRPKLGKQVNPTSAFRILKRKTGQRALQQYFVIVDYDGGETVREWRDVPNVEEGSDEAT